MESNKQERKNLVNDNPMAKRASEGSPAKNLNKGYGSEVKSPMAMMKSKKPSTAFAMKMSETRSALPMNMPDSPMKKALIGDQDKLPQALQDDIKAAPDSPAKMSKTPLKNHKPGHKDPKTGNEGRSADNVGAVLDEGGTRTQKDATTGKKISTDAKSRKMNKDAASGKINKKLTGNVTQKNGNYSAKPYKGKMMDHGRLGGDGKTFTRTTGGKNSSAYRAELKKHNKDKADYMQTANQKAKKFTKRGKNA